MEVFPYLLLQALCLDGTSEYEVSRLSNNRQSSLRILVNDFEMLNLYKFPQMHSAFFGPKTIILWILTN